MKWAVVPVLAAGLALFGGTAAASTVQIDDQSNVLNVTTVQNEAAILPVPIYIWTTTQDAANKSTFDNDVRLKVSSQFPIVLGINTRSQHESLQIGSASGFTQASAVAAEQAATSAFTGVMRSQNDYTAAVTSALSSLKSSLANRGSHTTTTRSGSGFSFVGVIMFVVFALVVVFVLRRVFRGRRRTMGPPPMTYGPGYGGPQYGPGYGPGYGGGGGMGAGAAGVAGAVGGGLLGYELGRMEGERRAEEYYEERRFDDNQNSGDQGGGWVVGQDGDFGGGGGGDFGGGGDW